MARGDCRHLAPNIFGFTLFCIFSIDLVMNFDNKKLSHLIWDGGRTWFGVHGTMFWSFVMPWLQLLSTQQAGSYYQQRIFHSPDSLQGTLYIVNTLLCGLHWKSVMQCVSEQIIPSLNILLTLGYHSSVRIGVVPSDYDISPPSPQADYAPCLEHLHCLNHQFPFHFSGFIEASGRQHGGYYISSFLAKFILNNLCDFGRKCWI